MVMMMMMIIIIIMEKMTSYTIYNEMKRHGTEMILFGKDYHL
jgi:hypothetical protein